MQHIWNNRKYNHLLCWNDSEDVWLYAKYDIYCFSWTKCERKLNLPVCTDPARWRPTMKRRPTALRRRHPARWRSWWPQFVWRNPGWVSSVAAARTCSPLPVRVRAAPTGNWATPWGRRLASVFRWAAWMFCRRIFWRVAGRRPGFCPPCPGTACATVSVAIFVFLGKIEEQQISQL